MSGRTEVYFALIRFLTPQSAEDWLRAMMREIQEISDDRERRNWMIGLLISALKFRLIDHKFRLGLLRMQGVGLILWSAFGLYLTTCIIWPEFIFNLMVPRVRSFDVYTLVTPSYLLIHCITLIGISLIGLAYLRFGRLFERSAFALFGAFAALSIILLLTGRSADPTQSVAMFELSLTHIAVMLFAGLGRFPLAPSKPHRRRHL